jgi:hypothetical protein
VFDAGNLFRITDEDEKKQQKKHLAQCFLGETYINLSPRLFFLFVVCRVEQ